MLEIRNIHVYYGQVHAVKGISLEVHQGKITAVLGANGAGKSTTLMTLVGAVPSQDGSIWLDGRDISRWRMQKIARQRITLVPEGRHIFPDFSVDENLRAGAYTVRSAKRVQDLRENVFELFPRLKERLSQKGGTLSGGEQQMLAIARGLMADPTILLLDEPSLGLAPKLMDTIFEHIVEINRQGITILLVEQNARLALDIAHQGYVLETGRVALHGTRDELRHNDRVRQAYLGL
ncbi:ABC transporter ATP-binding protein [candidate division KSB3 bacterium]|uniref:ABC transporter ATP-binding protein n=1 Tax=candidate division KSB3 bacterium TaxID=2044937 RepID=A0A2G6E1W0_9BACT|nr:MAG: ABC transporter ATP-binding protein [candidate division KSB3 bacterium]PIE28634.1 MAG: ABC transporter ATP-binding protein [candidate division KSB3 bacterium]